ncbi:hypothetical protein HKX48_000293 [Thoreauomyces humboldtii]|nr:hypothetical protein HKX48_000293 [Thoreauomyces humboldtii]
MIPFMMHRRITPRLVHRLLRNSPTTRSPTNFPPSSRFVSTLPLYRPLPPPSSSSPALSSSSSSSALLLTLTGTTLLLLLLSPTTTRPLDCSPTFQGVPVAATFLMHQALPRFDRKFPGLEISAVFDMARPLEFVYEESGGFVMASEATVEVPVFERLDEVEEAKLGGAGIRKKAVGRVRIKGTCSLGCAKVEMTEMAVFKVNGDLVWEWKKKK